MRYMPMMTGVAAIMPVTLVMLVTTEIMAAMTVMTVKMAVMSDGDFYVYSGDNRDDALNDWFLPCLHKQADVQA